MNFEELIDHPVQGIFHEDDEQFLQQAIKFVQN